MDIDALRSFIAFVDTGSFTRAARQTFRTQSAISMQMKKLEEETGQSLFVRKGRNLALTDDGQLLVSYARRILAMHDEALAELKKQEQLPPLIIGCPDDYAQSILPDIVELILTSQPEQSIRIHCDCSAELRKKLDLCEIDMAILTRSPEKEEGYLLRNDTGVWAWGGDDTLLTRERLPLILYEPDCQFHSTAIDGLERQGRAYQLIASSASATAIKSLVLKHKGITAMARSSAENELMTITHTDLPPLPAVDVVLALSTAPHQAFGSARMAGICSQYHKNWLLSCSESELACSA
ncbi:LysR family transcriptional regulator [Oceanospirillum sediminis]|uniref:LysR family transcriptional regulator n=1 Tax=Oceanospirillum sediminis TaxID=2760088 RepID=A0A839IV82_9GAMM|nr:LysR family transcriptional regulator [Oceanospirillum sediminis]MBB1488514.1 LysR family transcriptional regulator [Oceanospirillum sediminis]